LSARNADIGEAQPTLASKIQMAWRVVVTAPKLSPAVNAVAKFVAVAGAAA
jgi:hypothetical protein